MAIKVFHTNRKNTSTTVQVLLDSEGSEVKNLIISPNSFFYAKNNFITSSMRVSLQRQLVRIEKDVTIPNNLEYYKVYTPSSAAEQKQHYNKTAEDQKDAFNQPSTTESSPEPQQTQKSASELVKEYAEEESVLKTGKWDEEEVMYLKRVYPKKGAKWVAEKLNRAEKSVYKKAESLGVKKSKS